MPALGRKKALDEHWGQRSQNAKESAESAILTRQTICSTHTIYAPYTLPCKMTSDKHGEGFGVFEQLIIGLYTPMGSKEFMDLG